MKTEEDEAFEAIERRQGGFQAKRKMAADGFQAKRKMAADKLQEPSYAKEKPKLMLEKFREMKNLLNDTTPPPREWVGLTDEELLHIGVATGLERAAAQMIEAKLKEKNT
jgi:hypothetical protein